MKKITLTFASIAMILGFVACNKSTPSGEAEAPSKALNAYIDSVRNVTPVYNNVYWTAIDDGYKVRYVKAEAAATDETLKKQLEESKVAYQDLKTKYETEVQKNKEQTIIIYKQALRDALFGQGKIGTDLSFAWVTAANIREVYETFVNNVNTNRKTYSREDWDEVKNLYEALDTRKNEVESALATKDNLKIAKEKVRFASIESVDRPLSKVTENSDAKQ